ncbi:MAG: SH3 domain-containing protein [Eubacterium sp.]|nr:SH3 domain-containing protein [Eubacterium sp.]
MANRYDDETMQFIETRKRIASMKRAKARRNRNIAIAIVAAVVILVAIIALAATSCNCGSSKDEETTVATTTVEETTVEETTEEEETTVEDFAEGSKAYVTEEGVRLRAEASTDSDIVDELSKGTEVTIISNEDDWMKVKTDSEEGYINKDYLSAEKVSSDSSDDSEDVNSDNSSNDSEDGERTIETRKRTIDTPTKKSSSSSSSNKKSKTNDKRTLY